MRRWPAVLAGVSIATAFAGAAAPSPSTAQWTGRLRGPGAEIVATWRSSGRPPLGVLVDPTDVRWIAGDEGGLYLVADPGLQRVQTFRSDGSAHQEFGELGEEPGQLMAPVSADAEVPRPGRRLVVADSENFKLVLFDFESGLPVRDIAFPGDRPPSTVAFRPDGVIEAYDEAFAYAFEFDRDGEPLRSRFRGGERTSFAWETGGSMIRAYGQAIERMRADDSAWQAVNDGVRPGPFEAVAAGPSEWIFTYAARRLAWQPRSSYVLDRMLPGGVRAIAATVDGGLIAAMDRSGGRQAGLYRMNLEGSTRLGRWGDPLMVLGWIGRPTALTSSGADLYLVDGLSRVQRFDQIGAAHGQFRRSGLERAAFGSDGDAYVSRTLWGASTEDDDDPDAPPPGFVRHLVERWSFGGALTTGRHDLAGGLRKWTVWWDDPLPYDAARTSRLTSLEVDEQSDEVVALDANRGRVLRFRMSDGDMRDASLPVLDGRPGWSDMAVLGGRTLALHTGARRMVEVDPDGKVARQADVPPLAVRIASAGDGTVIATGTGWMFSLDPTGALRSAWPVLAEDGRPSPPSDLAVGADGMVFAADHAWAAVRVFRPGRGVADVPPEQAARAECTVEARAAIRPQVAVGQSIALRLHLRTACPEAPAGRLPDYGLRHADLQLELPDGWITVPGSALPPAEPVGGVATWQLDWLPPETTLEVALRAGGPAGRVRFDDITGHALDGWFSLHPLSIDGPRVDVIPFEPTLFMPALASS